MIGLGRQEGYRRFDPCVVAGPSVGTPDCATILGAKLGIAVFEAIPSVLIHESAVAMQDAFSCVAEKAFGSRSTEASSISITTKRRELLGTMDIGPIAPPPETMPPEVAKRAREHRNHCRRVFVIEGMKGLVLWTAITGTSLLIANRCTYIPSIRVSSISYYCSCLWVMLRLLQFPVLVV